MHHYCNTWLNGTRICIALGGMVIFATTCSAQLASNEVVDSWLFSGQPEATIRQRFKDQAKLRIDQLDACCSLTVDQKKKLQFAAQGDIDRFFREIAKIRIETKGAQMNDQAQIQQIWNRISPYATRVQGDFFDETCLLQKVIGCALDSQQAEQYQQMQVEYKTRRERALTRQMIVTLEESLPLLADQRTKLLELLDQQPAPKMAEQFETYIGYAKLSRIDPAKLAEFLDKEQVDTIRRVLDRYIGVLQALPMKGE